MQSLDSHRRVNQVSPVAEAEEIDNLPELPPGPEELSNPCVTVLCTAVPAFLCFFLTAIMFFVAGRMPTHGDEDVARPRRTLVYIAGIFSLGASVFCCIRLLCGLRTDR